MVTISKSVVPIITLKLSWSRNWTVNHSKNLIHKILYKFLLDRFREKYRIICTILFYISDTHISLVFWWDQSSKSAKTFQLFRMRLNDSVSNEISYSRYGNQFLVYKCTINWFFFAFFSSPLKMSEEREEKKKQNWFSTNFFCRPKIVTLEIALHLSIS